MYQMLFFITFKNYKSFTTEKYYEDMDLLNVMVHSTRRERASLNAEISERFQVRARWGCAEEEFQRKINEKIFVYVQLDLMLQEYEKMFLNNKKFARLIEDNNKLNNVYEVLPVEDVKCIEFISSGKIENIYRKKSTAYSRALANYKSVLNNKYFKKELIPAERSSLQEGALRLIINTFKIFRKTESIRFYAFSTASWPMEYFQKPAKQFIYSYLMPTFSKYWNQIIDSGVDLNKVSELVPCQMDNPHGACDGIQEEQKENVVLTTHAEESVAEPVTITGDVWEGLCSPQRYEEFTSLMSRWKKFAVEKWSKDDSQNKLLNSWDLPINFVEQNLDSVNCTLFKQFAYFRSDLEIKLQINSNKFNCGQLQLSFYYGSDTDQNTFNRQNIWCASQMTHTIIDAAGSNDAVLKIPYRYYKPLMGTFKRSDDNSVLNMGKLRLFVLNQLKVPASDTNPVLLTLYMRFINPSFHGMKPYDIGNIWAENQMFSNGQIKGVVKAAASMVNQIFPDDERDNPSDIIPPKPMVPWSAHSWCIGDQTPEPINPLRLQASGNTPHPPGTIPDQPEQKIDYITSIFGLVKTVDWTKDQPAGTILARIPFSPRLAFDEYPQVQIKKNIGNEYKVCGVLPPVAVMSELFGYWRGSLDYRFDFIATQFHTGRIIVGFVPRLSDKNIDITVDQLTNCDHVVLDLRDMKQFEYTCSYLSDKPWWPRRSHSATSSEMYAPGIIFIAVMNQLSVTASISASVQFNIYMRGGSDFELHIPVSPRIGLSFNVEEFVGTGSQITYLENYGPPSTTIYAGAWHVVGGGSRIMLRYGPTSDHVTLFSHNDVSGSKINFDAMQVYKLDNSVNIIHPNSSENLKYLVPFIASQDTTYYYGAVFDTFDKAQVFARSWDKNTKKFNENLMMSTGNKDDGPYVNTSQRLYWNVVATVADANINNERNEVCGDKVEVQKSVKSTWNGLLTFGEQITNIKQLTRRYQPYAKFVSIQKGNSNPSLADFCFPVMPQGLIFDPTMSSDGKTIENPYNNRIRDGVIPIIASGYRFYRGSVRFRMIITGAEEGVFWLQHRPEYKLISQGVFRPDTKYSTGVFQTNYASFIQLTSMNNVVEFEVPFYLPGQFGLLQRPNMEKIEDAVHYSMGNIMCGFDTMRGRPKEVPYYVQIFYSMGDDMSFSVFQGFPPVMDLTTYDKVKIEAQGPITDFKNKVKVAVKDTITKAIVENVVDEVEKEMAEPKIVPIASTSTSEDSPSEPDETITDKLKNILTNAGVSLDTHKQSAILFVVTNLVHTIINPSIKQIAWSFASVLLHLGIIAFSCVDAFIKGFSAIASAFNSLSLKARNWYNSKFKKNPPAGESNIAGAQGPEDKVESAFISTCVTGMLALVKAKNKPIPKSIPNFASYLYDGLPKFSLTANGLFKFFENNLKMFKSIWYWLVSKIFPNKVLYTELDGASDSVIAFVRKVQGLLDARNADKVRKDPLWTLNVYECANIAAAYLAKVAVSSKEVKLPLFEGYCHKIIKLKDTLVAEMLCPPVRFEPFVICLEGETNVGKSHLAQTLFRQLFQSVGFKSFEELVYVRTPGVAYWNGLRNQPGCLFDDFLCLEDQNFGLQQIGELFCLKSKAVFNPPMAAIEEKKLRYNPLIVILCANKAYPTMHGVGTPEAWWRRRDVMIRVNKLDKYKNDHPRSLPKDVKNVYGHLQFQRYSDPGNAQSNLTAPTTYGEILSDLITQFHTYFDEECIQFDKALGQVKSFYPDPSESVNQNMEELLLQIEDLNKSRVPVLDQAEIEEYRKKMSHDMIGSDFTWFVKKKFLEKKVQSEKAKTAVATPSTSKIIANSDDDGPYSEEDKKVLANNLIRIFCDPINDREYSDVEPSAFMELLDTYNMIQHYDENKALKSCMIKGIYAYVCRNKRVREFIETDAIPATVANIKIMEEHNLDLVGLFRQLLNIKEKMGFSRHDPSKLSCLCWTCMRPETTVGASSTPNYISMESYLPQISRFDKLVECRTILGTCDPTNCVVEIRFNKAYELCLHKFENYSEDSKPALVVRGVKDLHAKGKLLITPPAADVIAQINQKWYERVWQAIPGWGTIIKRIVQGMAIFAGLLSLFRLGNMIFSATNECKAIKQERDIKAKSAVIVQELWDDPVYVKKFKDATSDSIAKSIVEASFREQEGTSYNSGTVAAKVRAPFSPKIISNNGGMADVMLNLVKRNTFWISIETAEKVRRVRCFGLYLNYFIILDHYIFLIQDLIQRGESVKVYFVQDTARVELDLKIVVDCIEILDSTVRIGRLPLSIPAFKNAIKFLITSTSTKNIAPQGYLLEYILNDDGTYIMNRTEFQRINRRRDIIVMNDDGSQTFTGGVFEYERSGRGVCGSILCSSSNISNPILGIHVAGKVNGNGFAESLVRETFESLIKREPQLLDSDIINNMLSPEEALVFLDGNVRAVGCVPKNKVMYPPIKSRLKHSECYNKITQSTYDFPVLHSKDPRLEEKFSPLLEGCKHHTHVVTGIPNDFIKTAYIDLKKLILTYCLPQRMEVGKLSVAEAVCGIHDNPSYEALPMDTSEGFPWILSRPAGCSNKSWLFERELTSNGWKLLSIDTRLQADLEYKDKMRQQGMYFPTIFTDCLKDAKLPKEKCLLPGKTRIFSTSPVDYTIHQRQYNFDFAVAYQTSRFNTEHAIGIDIMSIECDTLVNRLLENSTNIIAADYSKFGDTLHADCVNYVFKIIIEWYRVNGDQSEENARARECLGLEVQNAFHLMLNYVYQCFGGMPSGNALTVVINSMVNSLYIRIAWLTIYHKKQLYSLYYFHQNVKLITYGDDLIMSVKDEVIEDFNCETIINALSKYFIKMTGATKDDKIYKFKNITDTEITFLKCNFVRHPRRKLWMAKMDRRSLEETCNWVWNTNKDERASSIEACDSMLQLAFGQGFEYYEHMRATIEMFWCTKGVFLNLPSWREVDMRIYNM